MTWKPIRTLLVAFKRYRTDPPNPIPGFDIVGAVNESCANQPVNNLVEVWKADSMTENIQAAAIAYFYARTIVDKIRSGNCNGGNTVIKNFYDPNGCDPPPPPPPALPVTNALAFAIPLAAAVRLWWTCSTKGCI